ncbi:MAG: FAD:protein transferase [Solirubrobacteraceae bacterium]|jgi:thiamine biosynthesis lipoprotein|nr:FAD:protein transferase [Solirubrobacteraceae bacterium]
MTFVDGRRHSHVEVVMGTVVSFDVRTADEARDAVADACAWLHRVDATFSTYRTTSEISRLNRGELRLADASDDVRAVIARCAELREQTRGAFDAQIAGTLDPSGYVKGWAAERAAHILERHGLRDFQINAGGDIVVRGDAHPGTGWRIGIRHPDRADALVGVVCLHDGAIATSGAYERGAHVLTAAGGVSARRFRSVTVTGRDLGTADAWATAILAWGDDGFDLLAHAPPDIEAFAVLDDTTVQTPGFPEAAGRTFARAPDG